MRSNRHNSSMKPIRIVFYLLLACNVLLAVLVLPPLGGVNPLERAGEADRLTRELAPEKIRILPDAARASPAAAAEPKAEQAAAEESAAPTVEQPAPAGGPVCVALTGLTAELVKLAREQAGRLGDGTSLRESGLGPVSYWVYLPPNGGKDGAEKRVEALKREGVEDYYVVREPGANQYAVSLGLYRTEQLAKRRLDALARQGVDTAQIAMRDATGNNARMEISGPEGVVDRFVNEFSAAHKAEGVSRAACRPT